jgi:hypothetical protein
LPADVIVPLYFLHADGADTAATLLRFNLGVGFLIAVKLYKVSTLQSLPAAFAGLKQ